jgi:hypothetical protein
MIIIMIGEHCFEPLYHSVGLPQVLFIPSTSPLVPFWPRTDGSARAANSKVRANMSDASSDLVTILLHRSHKPRAADHAPDAGLG